MSQEKITVCNLILYYYIQIRKSSGKIYDVINSNYLPIIRCAMVLNRRAGNHELVS